MQLLKITYNIFEGSILKCINLLSSWNGWLLSAVSTAIISFIGDKNIFLYYILAAITIDLFWGICSSRKQGKYTLSQALTKTAIKLAIYASVIFIVMMIEKSINADWFIATGFATAILCVGELISICGHILIIKPDAPVISIFRKWLIGEMAKKLEMNEKELKELLNNKQPIIKTKAK